MDVDSPVPPRSASPTPHRPVTPRSERGSADTLRAGETERTPGPSRVVLNSGSASPAPPSTNGGAAPLSSQTSSSSQPQSLPSSQSTNLYSQYTSSTQQSASSASASATSVSAASNSPMNGIHDSDADDAEHNDGTSCSSSGASIGPASHTSNGAPAGDIHVAGADDCPDDMDRFLRRVEMEKKIAQLQQRLELASIKTNHGWTDMSINEIETPPSRRPQVLIPNGNGPSYEPPSPARPWQLADVLWHNLPQPGARGAYPPRQRGPHLSHHPSHSLPALPSLASLHGPPPPRGPSSPRRQRMGMDEFMTRPTLSPLRGQVSQSHGHSHSYGAPSSGGNHRQANGGSGSRGGASGHRRSSSSISSLQFLSNDPYPASPLRTATVPSPSKKPPKKRSQSHSTLRDPPSSQDVDAARALAFMFGSGRSPTTPTQERMPPPEPPVRGHVRHGSGGVGYLHGPFSGGPPGPGPILPPPHSGAVLPSPFSPELQAPPRPRAQSVAVPDSDANGAFTGRPFLPPPPIRKPPSHSRVRGQSMDSSATFRSYWRNSPERDREAQRERERGQREGEDARERDRERERARSITVNTSRGGPEDEGLRNRGDEDKAAVELMMFLAHSPSPVRKRSSTNSENRPTFGTTARVLFADDDGRGPSGPPPGSMGPPMGVRR